MSDHARLARVMLLVGALLLAIAGGLLLWDLSGGDSSDEPAPITGATDSP